MNYININKKRLVGRNNQQLTNQIIIDYSTIEDISFQLINDQNQIQEISYPSGLYLAGSIGIGKQSYELLFLSKDYTITPENIIIFSLDTYTTNYLNYIKKKNTEINIEIGQESLNTKRVILRDYALACPRVYVSGLSPQEIDSKNYYTKTEVDELISQHIEIPTKVSELENDVGYITGYVETDPIYTADKPSIALKNEIPTKVSELDNDSGFISGYTETDPVYSATSGQFQLKSEAFDGDYNSLTNKPSIPSKTSELQNDSGFISGYTETDPIYTADKPSIALKSELFSGSYNDLTDKPSIPSKTSDLTNDSGFISGYTETDPIYTADKPTLALKSEIPTKVSDLENDSGFISGYTETDPIFAAQSGQFELKSEAFSGSYTDLTDKPTIPSKTSDLNNDSGFISGYTETDPIFSSVSGNLVQLNQQGKIPTSLYGTNKHNIIVDSTPKTGTFELSYNPNYEVFINEITLTSNTLDIGQIDFTDYSLNSGETATLENWLTFTNQDNAETISINSNISNVGDIPETLSGTQIHVFVRRVYKDSNNNIHEAISYAYSF